MGGGALILDPLPLTLKNIISNIGEKHSIFNNPLETEQAHLSLGPKPAEAGAIKPRAFTVRFLRFQEKDKVLRWAWVWVWLYLTGSSCTAFSSSLKLLLKHLYLSV